MRDFKGMKRQRGRNRGGGGNQGGGKQQHNVNRAFDSNGPDGVKIRGHAQHVFEKYSQLARDASGAGDRVLAENYLQHAEHYFRVLRAVQPQRPLAEIIGRDSYNSNYDIDFEDESGANAGEPSDQPAEGASQEGEGDQNRGEFRQDYNQNNQNQNNQGRPENRDNRDNRQEGGRQEGGQQREWRDRDRNRDRDRDRDGPRQEYRDAPRQDAPRQDGPRNEGQRQDAPRREFDRDRPRNRDRDRNRDDRPERDQAPAAEAEPVAAAPQESFSLRAEDGAMSPAPAFLQRGPAAAPAPEAAEPEKKPRRTRRRAPRAGFEGEGESGGSAPAESEDA